jgi:hypothetical protein
LAGAAIAERRRVAKVVAIRWLASERRSGMPDHCSRAFQTAVQEKLRRVTRSSEEREERNSKSSRVATVNTST